MTQLTTVPSYRIKAEWPKVLPFIRKALAVDTGRYTEASIFDALHEREMQLWAAIDPDDGRRILAICITEIRNYPGKKVGTLFLCAGDGMADWLPHLTEIEAWFKSKGCQESDIYGRPGWAKMLPDYTFARVLLRKEL